ncbi:hypothetical protein U1Q18_037846 [Sarracenia purpurea var. burkii]
MGVSPPLPMENVDNLDPHLDRSRATPSVGDSVLEKSSAKGKEALLGPSSVRDKVSLQPDGGVIEKVGRGALMRSREGISPLPSALKSV